MERISPTEQLARVAGFLEGEGCFGFYGTPETHAPQTYTMECLEWCRVLFGGTIRPRPASDRKKASYRWSVYGNKALVALYTILPWMTQRRQEQIRTAIAKAEARVSWSAARRQAQSERTRKHNAERTWTDDARRRMSEATRRGWATRTLAKSKTKRVTSFVP